jgi:signal transduction histidine kinase
VRAVNQALARLEAGFRAQREFTADMAHELRTPLAIMRARVDSVEDLPLRRSLETDIVNMTRTVNQVLDIAELEVFVVDGDSRADLQNVCADAVAFMAPLVVDSDRTIALTGAETPVWVHGHAEALFRAVRNLVENAIRHTPAGGAIEVDVAVDGTVRVLDEGPGVPLGERETIFKRFWRRDRAQPDSRGLGLAIVTRVAAAHGGTISVDDRPGGGAVFTLRLRPARPM